MEAKLKILLGEKKLTQGDKLTLILFSLNKPSSINQIKIKARHLGLNAIKKWNISAILSKSTLKAIRTKEGWQLTDIGHTRAEEILGNTKLPRIISTLRNHIDLFKDIDTKKFLEEAISCYESKFYRAAIVLSWIGAVDLLYSYVISNHLTNFNNEAATGENKWKPAKNKDDLSLMKESNFLDILQRLSIIGKNVKQELQSCLHLRNSCGHPNSLKIADSIVAAHLEVLLLNVFSKFS
jgi:hypothetical protein